MNKLMLCVMILGLTFSALAQGGDCVCTMQGRFVGGQYQFDMCDAGNCNIIIPEGLCELRAGQDAAGNVLLWCDCEFSDEEWPTICVCSGYISTGPTPAICWTVHGCGGIKLCDTTHWWPLPAVWVPVCKCN